MREKIKNNRTSFLKILFFSFGFGLIFSISSVFKESREISLDIVSFIAAAISSLTASVLLISIINRINKKKCINKKYDFKLWLMFSVFFVCIYSIAFLTFFPGTSYCDTLYIMRNGMMMGNQFPVLYCFIIVLLTKLGEFFGTLIISAVLYNIFQIFIISFLTGWVCFWAWNKNTNIIIKVFVFMFFTLNPVLHMYSISIIKDTVFSITVIVLITVVFDLLLEKRESNRKWFFFAFCTALLIIFRNNGIFIVVPLLLMLFFELPESRKAIMLIFFEIAILLAASKLLEWRFNIVPLFKEAMAVPIQQISAVIYEGGNVTGKQLNFINSVIPVDLIKSNYDASYVDPVKWSPYFNDEFLNTHKLEFLKIWAEMLPNNFKIYVKAYLSQTYWFWSPQNYGDTFIVDWLGGGVPQEWMISNGLVITPIIKGRMYEILYSFYESSHYFPCEGLIIWLMFVCCFIRSVCKGDKLSLLIFSPAILCWMTLMISSPCNSGTRYTLPFIYGIPVFISLLFINSKNMEKKERI